MNHGSHGDPAGLRDVIRRGDRRRLALGPPSEEVATAPASVFALPSLGPDQPARMAVTGSLPSSLAGTMGPLLNELVRTCERSGILPLMSALIGQAVPGAGPSVYDLTLGEPDQATAEISTNEMRRIVRERSAHVFDGRTELEFAIGHIPTAVNVTPRAGVAMSQYVSDVAEIGRVVGNANAPIVLYCNGPFCGKSRRLGAELVRAGYANVRRYQLGTPVWRALVGTMVIEPAGVRYVHRGDRTAAFLDARSPAEAGSGTVPGARNVPVQDVIKAKDDGRLPMDDFNTRVIAFGRDGIQARELAEALVGQGFNNVKYFDGSIASLMSALR